MRRRGGIAVVLLALLGLLCFAALVVGGCAYQGYQRAVKLDESVDASWAQVENVLQRRFDLIPNLVETVKGYAEHERDIFTSIAESRERYFSAKSRDEKVQAANGLDRALSRLLVLQERYPELKAQQNFLELQSQLEGSENRIAVERKRYNDAVRELNTFVRGLTGQLFAGWAGVGPAKYFEADEGAEKAPRVDFGTRTPATQP